MARARFITQKKLAGRLIAISRRPIENLDPKISLLRLEFEIFWIVPNAKELRSLGKIACRDVVITPGVEMDRGVSAYVQGLGVPKPYERGDWENRVTQRPWIRFEFDTPNPEDERNPFKEVFPFIAADYAIHECDDRLDSKWVTPSAAAKEFGCSVSKLRRCVDHLEDEWSHRLVKRTQGNQRRVNLRLLKELWES